MPVWVLHKGVIKVPRRMGWTKTKGLLVLIDYSSIFILTKGSDWVIHWLAIMHKVK